MSGICGYVRTDGGPAEARVATAMSGVLAHRGGDGIGVHADGPAAVAATARHDTPESRRERQPLVGERGLILVADARIDNREVFEAFRHFHDSAATRLQSAEYIIKVLLDHIKKYIREFPQEHFAQYVALCKRVLEIGYINRIGDIALAKA